MYSTRLDSLVRDDPHLPRHQLVEHCFEQRLPPPNQFGG